MTKQKIIRNCLRPAFPGGSCNPFCHSDPTYLPFLGRISKRVAFFYRTYIFSDPAQDKYYCWVRMTKIYICRVRMTRKVYLSVFQTTLFVILILPACPAFEKSQKGLRSSIGHIYFQILHGQEYYCTSAVPPPFCPADIFPVSSGKYTGQNDKKGLFVGFSNNPFCHFDPTRLPDF